jgi:hypothetical protein
MADQIEARTAMKRHLKRYENEAARAIALKSLAASIRSSQPIKVGGTAGADRRTLFLQWAQKRLEPEDVARIQTLDRNYVQTAAALGLMRGPKESDDEDLAKEMEKRGWNKATQR